ncbi:hypothetical protein AMECASPLE_029887 [Ameca splendens]|uniref:Uncharacterized protein n=1 Tax=Ameca splendens TaxID=208324 RepID=A0ABV1A1C5_9TELE
MLQLLPPLKVSQTPQLLQTSNLSCQPSLFFLHLLGFLCGFLSKLLSVPASAEGNLEASAPASAKDWPDVSLSTNQSSSSSSSSTLLFQSPGPEVYEDEPPQSPDPVPGPKVSKGKLPLSPEPQQKLRHKSSGLCHHSWILPALLSRVQVSRAPPWASLPSFSAGLQTGFPKGPLRFANFQGAFSAATNLQGALSLDIHHHQSQSPDHLLLHRRPPVIWSCRRPLRLLLSRHRPPRLLLSQPPGPCHCRWPPRSLHLWPPELCASPGRLPDLAPELGCKTS